MSDWVDTAFWLFLTFLALLCVLVMGVMVWDEMEWDTYATANRCVRTGQTHYDQTLVPMSTGKTVTMIPTAVVKYEWRCADKSLHWR